MKVICAGEILADNLQVCGAAVHIRDNRHRLSVWTIPAELERRVIYTPVHVRVVIQSSPAHNQYAMCIFGVELVALRCGCRSLLACPA